VQVSEAIAGQSALAATSLVAQAQVMLPYGQSREDPGTASRREWQEWTVARAWRTRSLDFARVP
jgi:hypothetical protein